MNRMRRFSRIAMPPLAAALVVGLTLGLSPLNGPTEAAWTDAQYAGNAVSAGTLDVPVITACTAENATDTGSLASLTITWTSTLDDESWMFATLTAGTGTPYQIPEDRIVRSGPSGGLYTYTFTATVAELEAALGPLTSASIAISVATRAGTSWVSQGDARRTVAVGTLAGGLGSATCDLGHVLAMTGLTAATTVINRVIPVGTAATSSLPANLQDRRRTPEYTVTVRDLTTNAVVANTEVTLVLPDGLAFESGANANQSRGTFTTSATGTVTFRVVGNRSQPAAGPVRVDSPRALSILSGAPVTSVPLVAWGYAPNGETGSDFTGTARTSAVPLWDNLDITGATAVGSTYSGLFYSDQNGNLWARGYNASGTLGDGTATVRTTVVPALTGPGQQLGNITYIGTGTEQLSSMAVDSSGGVWATGDAENSGFGPGYTNTRYWQRVSDRYANMPAGVGAISAEVNPWGSVLMVLNNGQAMVAGIDSYGFAAQGAAVSAAAGTNGLLMLTAPGTPIENVTSGSLGWYASAVVTGDGKLYTAGNATYGGSGNFYLTEKALPAGKTAAKVVVRQLRMFVIMTDGTVYALGTNTSGSLGTGGSGSPGATLTPVALPAGSFVTDAAMANDTSLFLLNDGSVYFAGINDTGGAGAGATGGGPYYTPVRVPLAHTAKKIGASWYDSYIAELG